MLGVVALSAMASAKAGPAFRVNFSSTQQSPFPHIWRATGWCPPGNMSATAIHEYGTSESSWLNHAHIRAAGGIDYVRIHDLLNLIEVRPGSTSMPDFYFSKLDGVLDLVVRDHGFDLGFEIMGNPSGYFTDWGDVAQLVTWRRMVREIAERYVGRYGLDVVRRWRWEGWNEPDHKCNSHSKMAANITRPSLVARLL